MRNLKWPRILDFGARTGEPDDLGKCVRVKTYTQFCSIDKEKLDTFLELEKNGSSTVFVIVYSS